jgi:hypothetical protein
MAECILIIDMRSLRLLYAALTVGMFFFAVGTVVAVVTTPATLGSGVVGLHGTVDHKLAGPAVRAVSAELPYRVERGDVRVTVRVPPQDRDTRRVMAAGLLAAIALAWVGLVSLRGVVGSARDGRPFDAANVTRLRLVGGAIVAAPLVIGLVNRLLESTFDSELVRVDVARVDVGPTLLIGLGVLALSEVFRQGVMLRELEDATV